jgi:hypothetical protein
MSYKRKIQQAISLKQHGGSSLAAIREAIIKMHWLNVFKTSMHICKISMTQFIKNINKKTRIHCIILNGKSKGETMSVFRVKLQVRRSAEYPYLWTRTQFPLRLAWAMTINRAKASRFVLLVLILRLNALHMDNYMWHCPERRAVRIYIPTPDTSEESGLPNVVIYKES